MPNHVTNKLEITGPVAALEKLRSYVRRTSENGENIVFSFDTVIPMPECLRNTISGSWVSEAVWLLDEAIFYEILKTPQYRGGAFFHDTGLANVSKIRRDSERFCTKEDAIAWLGEHRPDILQIGTTAIKAFQETGYVSWYEWCITHWGTKWDAYSVDFGDCLTNDGICYVFDTAWSPPVPVLTKLSRLFPSVTIAHSYFDEGHNFWGVDIYQEGECISSRDSDKEDYVRLCCDLKGYDPSEENDDEECVEAASA